jgi:hypothetical protein
MSDIVRACAVPTCAGAATHGDYCLYHKELNKPKKPAKTKPIDKETV